MPQRRTFTTVPQRSRESTKQLYKGLDEEMFTAYEGPCMISELPSDDFEETNVMSGCHVIAKPFLLLIANRNGEVYTWPLGAHQLGSAALLTLWDVASLYPVPVFEGLKPEFVKVDSHICKSRLACQPHDNKAFEDIDAPETFDPLNPDHQFLLAFRAIAGTTAKTEGILKVGNAIIEDCQDPEYAQAISRQHGLSLETYQEVLRQQLQGLDQSIKASQARLKLLRDELPRWQAIYTRGLNPPILTVHLTARPRVRVAISAVTYQKGRAIASYTVLPKPNSASGDKLYDIILTCMKPQSLLPVASWRQHQHMRREASKIKTFLESEPSEGMANLVKALSLVPASYFFISPDDYRDNTIVSRESRVAIETAIADVANERFPSSPEQGMPIEQIQALPGTLAL